LWWVDLGWLPNAHPAALALPLLSRTGGENKMQKLVRQDKDGEITQELPPWAKQTTWRRLI